MVVVVISETNLTNFLSVVLLSCWLPSARHAGSKTLHQQNPPVVNWRCWPTQVDLYNGRKTVVVVVLFCLLVLCCSVSAVYMIVFTVQKVT